MAKQRAGNITRTAADSVISESLAARVLGLRYPWWRLGVGCAVAALAAVIAASQGSVYIPPGAVVELLASLLPGVSDADRPASWETILFQLRLPRVALALIVGAGLAMSGAAYQGCSATRWRTRTWSA